MTDYIEFAAKIKEKYPQYKDVDDLTLAQKVIEKYPQYKEQVTFENVQKTPKKAESKGIDLTPSGIVKKATSYPAAALRAALKGEDFDTAMENTKRIYNEVKPAKGLGDTAVDLYAYSQIPLLRAAGGVNKAAQVANTAKNAKGLMGAVEGLGDLVIKTTSKIPNSIGIGGTGKAAQLGRFAGNAALQGGLPGALEGLKTDNAGGGATTGTSVAALLSGVLPVVGKAVGKAVQKPAEYLGKKAVEGLTDLKPETLKQVIKPNSQALDLTEDTAQNLLMDTTERLQKDYQSLIDNAGQEIQKAAMNLPEERGVFASSLKNALDDIFNGSQVSGNPALNPAMNSDKDIYNTVAKLIDSSKNGVKFTAPEMYDLMGNIKRIPINWESTTANESNALKQMLYGDFARRLGNLSPELRAANKAYSDLAKFEKNEGIRNILLPKRKGDIDSASKALRNYNSTVTKGNTNRNIQDLEKILVNNGKQPFINDIDDVNAAMDLLTQPKTGRNFLGAQTIAKGLVTPALKAIREANRNGIPQKIQNIQEMLKPIAERLPMAGAKGLSNMLYGGISYNDYQ